jgi:DNA-binding beta-propeller fold protein YncE
MSEHRRTWSIVAASFAAALTVAFLASRLAAAGTAGAPSGHASVADYRVLQTLPLGGDGGWDYLAFDGAGRRLFITRGSRVMVLAADSGKVVGEIPNLSGVHGVAFDYDQQKGFVSNGRSDTVTVFDLKTLATLGQWKSTGQNPDCILYDPRSRRVFAFNGRSGNATAFESASGAVAGTVVLGGKPEFAATDNRGSVFVNIEDKSELVAIDSAHLTVSHRWPLAGCEEPTGLSIDSAHCRLIVGCGNETALIVDSGSGRVVAKLPIGKGVDATAYEAGTGLAFTSNGEDGTLSILREEAPDSWAVAANVPTRRGARTLAVDEKTHRILMATAEFGPRPQPTAAEPHPRPTMVPGSFVILVVGPATSGS